MRITLFLLLIAYCLMAFKALGKSDEINVLSPLGHLNNEVVMALEGEFNVHLNITKYSSPEVLQVLAKNNLSDFDIVIANEINMLEFIDAKLITQTKLIQDKKTQFFPSEKKSLSEYAIYTGFDILGISSFESDLPSFSSWPFVFSDSAAINIKSSSSTLIDSGILAADKSTSRFTNKDITDAAKIILKYVETKSVILHPYHLPTPNPNRRGCGFHPFIS